MAKSCFSKEKIEAASYCAALSLNYSSLKDDQREIVVKFCRWKYVFAILPTGYGKAFVTLVYPAYLINFVILQILLSLFCTIRVWYIPYTYTHMV